MGIFKLPEGYREIKRINLQKDIKLAVLVNLGALMILAGMFIAGAMLVPVSIETFVMGPPWHFGVLLLALAAYIVLHELVHGFCIWRYSGKRAKFGFTGLYAFAGSDAFFSKRQYRVIALVPIAVFGLLLLALNILLPASWFWPVYFLQAINLSGAAGDLYVTWLLSRLPAQTLVADTGIEMAFFSDHT